MKLHELQEKRSAAVVAMRALADKVEAETRDYTADEETRHAAWKSEITDLDAKIQRAKDIAEAERAAPAVIAGNGRDGRYEDRAREFSVVTAIRDACGDRVDAGRERELSAELVRRTGRAFEGVAVPDEVFLVERRTLTTGGAAADLVPNQHLASQFIDMRRSAIVTARLGATVLDGLVGTVDIPKQTASSTAQWVAEDSNLTETDASFSDVNLTPRTVGSMTSYSRRTMLNAVPAIETLVRNDLAAVVARAIDRAAIFGAGTSHQPTGILATSNIFTPSLATPSWSRVLDFIASIQSADAEFGSLGWAMSPRAVAKLRSTNKAASEPEHGYIMQEAGTLAGYPVATSTILSDGGSPELHTVVFAAWSQLLIARWSGVDIMANPFSDTNFPKGRISVRAMTDVDVGVRHAESFAASQNLPE